MALAVLSNQVRRGPPSDDFAMVHDRDIVCELLRLIQIMRRQEDRRPFALELSDEPPQLPPGTRIEARGRLVEEDELRFSDEGHRDAEATSLAAGEIHRERVRAIGQSDGPDQARDLLLGQGAVRSEERRVGKECRAGWAPYE